MISVLALMHLIGAAVFGVGPSREAAAQTGTRAGLPVISDIRVEGNQRIEAETVRSSMVVGIGDRMDPARIDQSLKTLFETGLFADVTIRRAGDALVVTVVENPIINQRVFEGNRRLSDEVLQAEVQLRPRVVYTRARISNDVQRILQLYRRAGRFSARVEPKVIQLPQNRVDLVFEIDEGALTKIRRISFVGNRKFSDGQLRDQLTTKESCFSLFVVCVPRFLSATDHYDPDRLTFDREQLRRFYLSKGFADSRVISAVAELSHDRKDFFITFSIDEGETYRFGALDVDSSLPDLQPEQLSGLITAESGGTYNAQLIEESIQRLTFETGRLGYAFVEISPRPKRDREARTIDVTFEIQESPRVYVERINITGNVRTLDEVIRREFRLAEGDAFNTAKLRRSRREIRGLGFFDRVEISERQGRVPDRTVITADVEERSTGELSIGAGVSTNEGFIGDLSIRERNLLGKGQDLRLGFNISQRRQEIDLSFTEPYFLDRRLASGFDVFNRRRDFQDESSFDESNIGFALRAGFPITENLRQTLNYTLRQDSIENVGAGASRFIREQEGERISSSIGYQLVYDIRDDRLEPTSGYIVRLSQDVAGLGGQVRYLKTAIDYSYYYPLPAGWIASVSLRDGYVFGIGQDVGIADRFFLGGSSFRGFQPGGVGPRDRATGDSLGGKVFYVGTGELTFPLGLPNEYGILGRMFALAGSLAQVDEGGSGLADIGSVRVSSGFGLSWRSPLGPVRVDYSIPLVKEDFDETEAFRFSFGTRF